VIVKADKRIYCVVLAAIVSAWSCVSAGQEADDGHAGAGPGLDDAAAQPASPAEYAIEILTPQEAEELLKQALQARLRIERRQVVAEMRQGLLFDPDEVDKAEKMLNDSPADTQKDNIERIFKALGMVDIRFTKACRLYAEGRYAEAAETAKPLLNPQDASCLSAARHYLAASACSGAGMNDEAVEIYRHILSAMPDRISFAAQSALNAARAYEKMSRGLYAMEMYSYCLKNYGLTLDQSEADELVAQVRRYAEIYKDPLGSAAAGMTAVQARLEALDSGPEPQKRQGEAISLIEDLIKTAEEQQASSGAQGRQQQAASQPGGQEDRQASAGQAGQPMTTGRPASPAQRSALVPGAVRRPARGEGDVAAGESDDWAQMPPRQRQQLQQIMRKVISERYRDIISDYHRKLAETPGD